MAPIAARLKERTMQNIAGTWYGVYQYQVEEKSVLFQTVEFTMILEQGWLGRLRGTIRDDPESMQAAVQGRIKGRKIFFRKIPTEFVTLGQNGYRPVAEYVRDAFGEEVRGTPRPPHVHYHGLLDTMGDRVEGVWHIPSYLLPLRSSRGYLIFPETQGTWWVQRQPE
jgi:hypothetical protein